MLSQQPEADALLDRDPLALLIGMLLDQQIPLEKAFSSPYVLARAARARAGRGTRSPGRRRTSLVAIFAKPPALHRFPGRWPSGCRRCAGRWSSTTTATRRGVWDRRAADGEELLRRVAGAARLRQAEGADLRGAARQAVRRRRRRAGGRPPGSTARRATYQSVADIARRRVAGRGAGVQEADEGRRQGEGLTPPDRGFRRPGRAGSRTGKRRVAGPRRWVNGGAGAGHLVRWDTGAGRVPGDGAGMGGAAL